MQVNQTRTQRQNSDEIDTALALRSLAVLGTTTYDSLTTAVDSYLSLLMRLLHIRSAFIGYFNDGLVEMLEARTKQGCLIASGSTAPQEQTPCQYVRATREPVVICDTSTDPRVMSIAGLSQIRIGSYLGVPLLLSDGTLYGTLCAVDPDPRLFTATHVDVMNIIAAQLAGLIERHQMRVVLSYAEHESNADVDTMMDLLDQQTMVLKAASHDLRSPLNSMYGAIDLLDLCLPEDRSPDIQIPLNLLRSSTRYMNRLVNDLLDAAATDSPAFSVINNEIDLYDLTHSVYATMEHLAEQKGLRLYLETPAHLPTIVSDPDRIRQILLNLMSNALNYTETGNILLSLQAHADSVEVRVADTGVGIAVEDHARIWEQHTRVSTATKGFGLGLYVVRQLVRALGGEIGVESADGAGSTFSVRLPLHSPAPHAAAWASASSA